MKGLIFSDFIKKANFEKALRYIGVFNEIKKEIQLTFLPDFDICTYKRLELNDYPFKSSYAFEESWSYVINCEIEDYYFRWEDDLDQHGEINDYKLLNVKLLYINNTKKTILFEGGILGDSFLMDNYSLIPYVAVRIKYVPKNNNDFYIDLLSESLVLFEEGRDFNFYEEHTEIFKKPVYDNTKIRLAFFNAFSAFDLFINLEYEKLLKKNNKKIDMTIRLQEKLQSVYKSKFGNNLSKDRFWSSFINEFKKFVSLRDEIAHGNKNANVVNEKYYKNLIIVIISFIVSMREKENKLDVLLKYINEDTAK